MSRDSPRSFAGVATAIYHPLPLELSANRLLCTRSLQVVIVDYSEAFKSTTRTVRRVRMSKNEKNDLKEWRRIGEGGRTFVDEEPQ